MSSGRIDKERSRYIIFLQCQVIKAKEWNINPADIGIMGSSAGGHLASTMATHVKSSVRPAFQVLFYPVITMDKSFTHLGSHDNLLGKDASRELEDPSLLPAVVPLLHQKTGLPGFHAAYDISKQPK